MAGPRRPLIDPTHLLELLAGRTAPDRVVVLDVRWRLGGPPGRPDHDRAHIPDAVFVDLDDELADPPGPAGRHPLPTPERLQAALRRAGVGEHSHVVAHDDGNGTVAARAWWVLRWAGLPAEQVSVLDGGFAAWVAAGLPTTAEPSHPAPGRITVRPGAMPVLDADGAASVARNGLLLDARAAPRYRGEVEPVDPRAGHIPGAVNAPATDVAGPDGRWAPPPVLEEWFAALGLRGAGGARGDETESPAGAYCGSGVNATALVLAAEYAGIRSPSEPVALYVGSWSNWSADARRPAATGGSAGGDPLPSAK